MEIWLMVIPFRYIQRSVIKTEIGIEAPTISVDFKERRKMNRIAMARSAP